MAKHDKGAAAFVAFVNVVENRGFDPLTPALPAQCSPTKLTKVQVLLSGKLSLPDDPHIVRTGETLHVLIRNSTLVKVPRNPLKNDKATTFSKSEFHCLYRDDLKSILR